ncbi:MAG TPA: hypothetical protein V6D23_10675 [Candidatus Obscuribacterales bacterium]
MLRRWIPILLLAVWMSPALALDPSTQVQNTFPKTAIVGTELVSILDNVPAWDQPQAKKAVSGPKRVSAVGTSFELRTQAAANWSFPAAKQARPNQNQGIDANDIDADDIDDNDIEDYGPIPNYDKMMDIFYLTEGLDN